MYLRYDKGIKVIIIIMSHQQPQCRNMIDTEVRSVLEQKHDDSYERYEEKNKLS